MGVESKDGDETAKKPEISRPILLPIPFLDYYE
jgi:hypothetical protein